MSIAIYDYIKEQPLIMKNMLSKSKEITKEFVDLYATQSFNRIIMVGSGSSYNAAQSAKYFLQNLLKVNVDVQFAHAFAQYEEVMSKNTLLIGISQSGESTAAVESIKKAKERGMANLSVTSEDGSYITQFSGSKMIVPSGEEKAGATTKGYTSTVFAFYLAAIEIAFNQKLIQEDDYRNYQSKLDQLADGIEAVIDVTNQWYEKHKKELLSAKSIIVSGYGNNYGTALEAGLKFLETSLIPVSIYEVEEFMHGPYNAINENSCIFFISPNDKGKERITRLNEFFKGKTNYSYMVKNEQTEQVNANDLLLPTIEEPELTPLEYVIPFQVIFNKMATDKGMDNSKPVYPDFHPFMNSKRKIDF
jgi:glucoselysine-6-phosphate deglycase